ncbi:Bug family tripartite tricarboxylate transporter substrate binding protein [Diaphorobacter aerolatus]|uniref:Tripartite tricarboxylate transporter substrate binding protein n=1 Tax=Diaphorobacter aerolatus TaxID=1288495 RepID=A0A7H0GHE4_9BURK|nr:tripartite tricarboxylate transporter substrate binding protein [Diaphorobacter aerolatus]QNP47710.1 tripartite tricarboxylate transporter substrate binding protein [Diaphorobacter aerolatus]
MTQSLQMIHRRTLLQGAAALAGSQLLAGAHAQAAKDHWPSKPIKLIVPYNAGGATDILARAFGEGLSKRVGQPVIVDNRPGASGIVGTDAVAKAAPDGHTLLMSLSSSMLVNQFLFSKLPYNPLKDITLITQVSTAPVVLAVHPSLPVKNMKELLAYAKAHPSKLSYGSYGVGSYAHLAGAYISKITNSDMNHAAYKGESQAIQELISGQYQFGFLSAQNVKPHTDTGRIKAIGVTGRQRMVVMPDVPTIYEQGVQDDAFSLVGWIAMGGPAGLPKEIITQLYAHLLEVSKDPKVQERITGAGFAPMMSTPEQFREGYLRDVPVWKALVETAGAKLD